MVKKDMEGSKSLEQHLQAQGLTEKAVDLLCNLLTLDPSKRLTARQAFEASLTSHASVLQQASCA